MRLGYVVLSVFRKEGNVLFNDACNTFYLQLYGIRHIVKDHSDSERGNLLPPHRLSVFRYTGYVLSYLCLDTQGMCCSICV